MIEGASTVRTIGNKSYYDSNNLKSIEITNSCSSGCNKGAVIALSIQNITNPSNIWPISGTYKVSTTTSDTSLIDQGSTSLATGTDLISANF